MTHDQIVQKLLEIRPGSEWNLRKPEYDGLEWLDKLQSKPTQQELGL